MSPCIIRNLMSLSKEPSNEIRDLNLAILSLQRRAELRRQSSKYVTTPKSLTEEFFEAVHIRK